MKRSERRDGEMLKVEEDDTRLKEHQKQKALKWEWEGERKNCVFE